MKHPALDKKTYKIHGKPVTVHTNFMTNHIHIYAPGIKIKTSLDAYMDYQGDLLQFIIEELRKHD